MLKKSNHCAITQPTTITVFRELWISVRNAVVNLFTSYTTSAPHKALVFRLKASCVDKRMQNGDDREDIYKWWEQRKPDNSRDDEIQRRIRMADSG